MSTSTAPQPSAARRAHRTRQRALGVAGVVLAPAIVWIVGVPVLGVDLRVTTDPGAGLQPVGLLAVVVVALVVSLLGWTVLALLERRTRRARAAWTATAVSVLLSLAGPLIGGVTPAATLTLIAAHIALAAVLITALRATSPTR